ncbi:MAG: zinc ribbon domain-containing protein [Syntrophales bacterium]|nr:zinc ribbon domain-containing protein [Syntrophales bacterium]
MPIYEYRCKKCGREFELFQKITDVTVPSCKFCQGPVEKLISLSSFHLKGTGWYVTDYGGKKTSGSEGKPGQLQSESGSEKAADTNKDD